MEDELRRLRRLIVRTGMVLVILLIIAVAYFSSHLHHVNNELIIARTTFEKAEPIKGQDGLDGKDGIDGIDGRDGANGSPGRDAVSVKETTIIEKPTIIQQNIPIPGP